MWRENMSKSFSVRPEGRHIMNKIIELQLNKLDLFREPCSHEKQVQFNVLESELLILNDELEPHKVY